MDEGEMRSDANGRRRLEEKYIFREKEKETVK
jgi:hypothetical protein